MRDWIKKQWSRFKAWIIGVLGAIGFSVGTVMVAGAAIVSYTWTLPTLNTDGSTLDISQIVETRIYCGVNPTEFVPQTMETPSSHTPKGVFPGPSTLGQIEHSWGRHDCFATILASYDDGNGVIALMESGPSGVATKIVAPPMPSPPGLEQ